jgi:hypothetical protein
MGTTHFYDWVAICGVVYATLFWVYLKKKDLAPKADSVRDFIGILDSRGGLIFILSAGSFLTFTAAMRLFYFIFAGVESGKLDEKSAVGLMAVNFVTGTAFGGCFGAMLALMKGGDGPKVPPAPGGTAQIPTAGGK